jgi:hypothetical protein
VVLVQGDRKIAFTGKEDSAFTKVKTAICALHAALGWEHHLERYPDTGLVSWARRTIIYPMEIADDLARVCGDISALIRAWESNVALKLISYEEAFAADPIAAQWISFAQHSRGWAGTSKKFRSSR